MPLIKQDFIDTLIRDADIVQVFQQNGEEVKKKEQTFFASRLLQKIKQLRVGYSQKYKCSKISVPAKAEMQSSI